MPRGISYIEVVRVFIILKKYIIIKEERETEDFTKGKGIRIMKNIYKPYK